MMNEINGEKFHHTATPCEKWDEWHDRCSKCELAAKASGLHEIAADLEYYNIPCTIAENGGTHAALYVFSKDEGKYFVVTSPRYLALVQDGEVSFAWFDNWVAESIRWMYTEYDWGMREMGFHGLS
jgi:hypothetical protein